MITEDTKQYSYRAEYEHQLEGQLQKVDAAIRDLGIHSDALNAKFQEAQESLRRLIDAPDDAWTDMRDPVDDVFFELNKLLDEVSQKSR